MILFYSDKYRDMEFCEEFADASENGTVLSMGLFEGAEKATFADELVYGIPAGAEFVFNTLKSHEELVSFLRSRGGEEPDEWVEIDKDYGFGFNVIMYNKAGVKRTGLLIKGDGNSKYDVRYHSLIGFTERTASGEVFDTDHPMYVIKWDDVSFNS